MATNFEFFKDEILEIVKKRKDFAVINGEVKSCDEIGCTEQCIFNDGKYFCLLDSRIEWLYAEHVEQPKLTKRERAFCEAVHTGWIARDFDDRLFWHEFEPTKTHYEWLVNRGRVVNLNPFQLFDFVKREDEKPWAVEDLLKLEVQHEKD